MATKFKPYQQTSITGYIREGKALSISESSISYRQKIEDEFIIITDTIIIKYYDALKKYITTYAMDDDEYIMYKQQPNKFCFDKYGTPELAYSLLYINSMSSKTEFKKRTINIFTDDILDAIKELLSLNNNDLIANRMEIAE